MTNAVTSSVTLTREQYDIAWHDLRLGDQPLPIAIRTHGMTADERAMIRQRVYGELTAKRLADGRRLHPDLEDQLALLARSPVRVEMTWLPGSNRRGLRNAVGVRSGEAGLLADLTDRGLVLTPVRGTGMVYELLGLLPKNGPASGQSITLPLEALSPGGGGDTGGGRHAQPEVAESIYDYSSPATAAGGSRQQVRALETLFAKPRLRGGHIEVTVLDRYGRRSRSKPIEWFDTEDGRCMAQFGGGADGGQHLTVAPADTNKIVSRLHEVIDGMTAR